MDIKNIATIVTGGGSGLGAATVKKLTAAGARVAILDTNLAASEKTAAMTGALALPCDITQEESVLEALAQATDTHGPARICINCAGIAHSRRLVNREGVIPLNEFRHIIEVNLMGSVNVMRLVVAAMIPLPVLNSDNERGLIINTASIAAYEGQIGQMAYSASKGALASLTLPAARELAQFGIRVMAIAPGLVETPLFANLSEKAKKALVAACPFPKRLAHPSEFADLVHHIITNIMLNGDVIRLDGSLRLSEK